MISRNGEICYTVRRETKTFPFPLGRLRGYRARGCGVVAARRVVAAARTRQLARNGYDRGHHVPGRRTRSTRCRPQPRPEDMAGTVLLVQTETPYS